MLNQQVPDKKIKRTLMSVNISPDYCYRKVKNYAGSYFNSISIELENKNAAAKFGYKITNSPIPTYL